MANHANIDIKDTEKIYLKRLEALERAYFPVARSKFTDDDYYVKPSSVPGQQSIQAHHHGRGRAGQLESEQELDKKLARPTCTFTADDRVTQEGSPKHQRAGVAGQLQREMAPAGGASPFTSTLPAAKVQHLMGDAGVDWKQLELRLPVGLSREDVAAVAATLQRHLKGGPDRVRALHAPAAAPGTEAATDKDQGKGTRKVPLMAMHVGGLPNSRMQTQLLASWLEVKLLALFSELPPDDGWITGGGPGAAAAAAASAGPTDSQRQGTGVKAALQPAGLLCRNTSSADGPRNMFGAGQPEQYATTAKDVAVQFVTASVAAAGSMGHCVARVAEDPALCRRALQVVGACAGTAVHSVAVGCLEMGLLVARLWNLQTQLLETQARSMSRELTQLRGANLAYRDQLLRLEPLLEWEKTARETAAELQEQLTVASAKLGLAESERQVLLVENDTIMRHSAKEIAAAKRQSEAALSKATRKLQKAEQKLARLQQGRDVLVGCVRACTGTTGSLAPLLGGVRGLLEDVMEERDLVALDRLLPSSAKASSASASKPAGVAQPVPAEVAPQELQPATDFPSADAADVAPPEPPVEAEAQTDLTGVDMDTRVGKVEGLDAAMRDAAALRVQVMELERALEAAGQAAEEALLQVAAREAAVAELEDQVAASRQQLQAATATFTTERQELQRRLSLNETQYTSLCRRLSFLGIDPDNPALPPATPDRPMTSDASTHADDLPQATGGRIESAGAGPPPQLVVPEPPSTAPGDTPVSAMPPETATGGRPGPASHFKQHQTATPASTSGGKAGGSVSPLRRKISPPREPPRISSPPVPTPASTRTPLSRSPSRPSPPEHDVGQLQAMLPAPFTNFKCKNPHLLEALVKATEVKVRALDWVLKTIDALYKAKVAKDDKLIRAGERTASMPAFVYSHLMGTLGIKALVHESVVSLVASLQAYEKDDLRVATFKRFLTEAWDTSTLEVFLDAWRKLAEPSRVPCLEFPPDYAPKRGDSPWVDVRKCLWIANRLLGKRVKKTTFAFAANLALQGEAAAADEVERYFVAPGYEAVQVAQVKQYELERGEFHKVAAAAFLDVLCREWVRCETILVEALPTMFQTWDANADGLLVRAEVDALVAKYAAPELQPAEVLAEANQFWATCQAAETLLHHPASSVGPPAAKRRDASPLRIGASPGRGAQGSEPQQAGGSGGAGSGMAVGVRRLPPVSPAAYASVQHISVKGFIEAAMSSELVRGHVRRKLTPPPALRYNEEEKEQLRTMLGIIASRHWRIHKAGLQQFFPSTGPLEPVLREHAGMLEKEEDGAKRAMKYHSILRLLIQKALDLSLQQCNPEVLVQGTATSQGFEAMLVRICKAVKVLYGCNAILEEDLLLAVPNARAASHSELMLQRQMLSEAAAVYNRMHQRMQSYAIHLLKSGGQKSMLHYVQRWRASLRRSTAQAAASVQELEQEQGRGQGQGGQGGQGQEQDGQHSSSGAGSQPRVSKSTVNTVSSGEDEPRS